MEQIEQKLHEVMHEKPGAQDWTQFSLSVRNAMIAAASIYGSFDDEQKHNLNRLLTELTVGYVIPNLRQWNILQEKKEQESLNESQYHVHILLGQNLVQDMNDEGAEYVREHYALSDNLISKTFSSKAEVRAYTNGLADAFETLIDPFMVLSEDDYSILTNQNE